jgi:hypothetical protein
MSKRAQVFLAVVVFIVACALSGYAQDSNDLDNYKWRVAGNWWSSHPSGHFGLNAPNNSYLDINKDFGFGDYSTFTSKIDWHFGHKHHFLLNITPTYSSRTATITRDITFAGRTFEAGSQVAGDLNALNIAPGYQYDIIRRDHGYLGWKSTST